MSWLFRTMMVSKPMETDGQEPQVKKTGTSQQSSGPKSTKITQDAAMQADADQVSHVGPELRNEGSNSRLKTSDSTSLNHNDEDARDGMHPDEWMIKPCAFYKSELWDCRGLPDRFNQYFVHGELRDCSVHKVDYENCNKWKDEQDVEALNNLVQSERSRMRKRIRNHLLNDVWEDRDEPPNDWNKPLPPEIEKEYQISYLEHKKQSYDEDARKLSQQYDATLYNEESMCVIV